MEDKMLVTNPLAFSYHDSAWIPILNPHNVMDYFSDPGNPFYDRTCNNEVLKMQRANMEQLANMTGIEYTLLHVQEPILYVIRKQHRTSPAQVNTISDYYIIGGVIYQAPDLGSVFNSRLLTTINHLQSAFDEAKQYSRYHPSRGYWWDFGPKSSSVLDRSRSGSTSSSPKKKKRSSERKKELEKKMKEEPSSLFQRRRVDMILDLLTRRFPPKVAPPTENNATATVTEGEEQSEGKATSNGNETEEKAKEPGAKREAEGNNDNKNNDAKRMRLN